MELPLQNRNCFHFPTFFQFLGIVSIDSFRVLFAGDAVINSRFGSLRFAAIPIR